MFTAILMMLEMNQADTFARAFTSVAGTLYFKDNLVERALEGRGKVLTSPLALLFPKDGCLRL
jgi:hypothetical protein